VGQKGILVGLATLCFQEQGCGNDILKAWDLAFVHKATIVPHLAVAEGCITTVWRWIPASFSFTILSPSYRIHPCLMTPKGSY